MILGSVAVIPDDFSGVAANARYLQTGDERQQWALYMCVFLFYFFNVVLKTSPSFCFFIVAYTRIVFTNVRLARALFYGIKERSCFTFFLFVFFGYDH